MPVEELADDQLVQRCSACATTQTVKYAQLAVGSEAVAGAPQDPRVVALPPCPKCGAQEFLVRSALGDPEPTAPGSYAHLHRVLVDHLHDVLASSKSPVLGAEVHGRVRVRAPVDGTLLKRLFPEGLKLHPPAIRPRRDPYQPPS